MSTEQNPSIAYADDEARNQFDGEGNGRTDAEYDTPELVLRALVQSRDAGIIIGQAGANIAKLREESGVKAGVSKDMPGVQDRVITATGSLSGPTGGICKFYELVCKSLAESSQQGIGMGGVNTRYPSGSFPMRFLISHNQMGTIIGRQGAKIKYIQETTGVRMVAQKDMLPQSTERIVEVTGTPESIGKAVKEIGKCLIDDEQRGSGTILYNPTARGNTGNFTNDYGRSSRGNSFADSGPSPRSDNPRYNSRGGSFPRKPREAKDPNDSSLKSPVDGHEELQTQNISISADMVGCIIGRAGSKISEIRKSSGARISIAKTPHDETGERMFTITGPPNANEKALYLLYENLESEKTRRSQSGPSDGA